MARRPRGTGDDSLRSLLAERKRQFLDRWPTQIGRDQLAAIEAGQPVTVSSGELFSALLPIDERAAMQFARVNGPERLYELAADNVLRELAA